MLCTIAPGTRGDPALRTCAPLLRDARWLGYLSTTGVYGDHGGGWVDETTPPRPGQPRSIERLAAERAWQAMGIEAGAAVDIFRLPGIYGPGRSAIDQVKAGTARRIDKPGQVFSRIHVEDIAAAVLAAMTHPSPGAIYNVADDLPASNSEVIAYACELLGLPVPPADPVGRGGADDERHGALLLCREPPGAERPPQARARRRPALSDLSRRACAPLLPPVVRA